MSLFLAALLQAAAQPAPTAEISPPEPASHAALAGGQLSNDDYPREARLASERGRTTIRFTVEATGRASDCRLWESSGSARLDRQACGLALHRFRYRPARDAAGQPVAEWLVAQFEWGLPDHIRLTGPVPYSETVAD